jgi:hypothetical protein
MKHSLRRLNRFPAPPAQGICRKPLKRQRQSALASPNLCTIRKNSLPFIPASGNLSTKRNAGFFELR